MAEPGEVPPENARPPRALPWGEFRAEVRRRKRERCAAILASEPPGRPAGRRPRDPEKERILAELDRRRIARSELLSRARRVPAAPPERSSE